MTVSSALGSAFWGRSLFAAEWQKLCFVTFGVDPAMLAARLPPGLSLELVDHQALVTLTFWQARYPKVLGVKPPEELSSVELAFRYLVREGARRGIVTLQEDSSSTLVAVATRSLFREPARQTRMEVREQDTADGLSLEYRAGGGAARVLVRADKAAAEPAHESLAYVVAHRPFAYSMAKDGELLRHDLDHPVWRSHAVRDYEIDVDFTSLYGEEWAALRTLKPLAVTLSEGSEVRASLPE